MNFTVDLQSRDFSKVILTDLEAKPIRFSWSCFGGPKDALIHLHGDQKRLIETTALLRSAVKIYDTNGVAAWWGFVDKVTIHLSGTRFSVSLDDLFNRVKVSYSFTSPDHQISDSYQTVFTEDIVSKSEYGTKEKVLYYTNIDDDFALSVRDTFLNLHAFPHSQLDTRIQSNNIYVSLHCSGWFQTLGWIYYSNSEGFYANYGPGPGVLPFSETTHTIAAQSFKPGSAQSLKHVYFRLNKFGAPASDPYVVLYSNSGNAPNAVLATSATVARATIPTVGYAWFCFTFAAAYSLSGTQYWAAVRSAAVSGTDYYQVRTDETNENAANLLKGMYFTGAAWANIPNVSAPNRLVSLYYRVVCLSDLGSQIFNIATAANQFFNHIWTFTTGTTISPYIQDDICSLDQIQKLMNIGTSNDRLILAKVSEDRNLTFYEQPSKDTPMAYLSNSGKFYTQKGILLEAWRPPVGEYAMLANTARFALPFDKNRVPTCFVRNATYYPGRQRLLVNA